MDTNTNLLVVLTGKTASGKDTIMAKLLSKYPEFKRVVTTTSRVQRPGETNGADYYFISRPDFEQKIANNEFIEHVEYAGNLYGTEKTQLTDNLHSDLIWRIDPSRAGQIRDFIKNSFDSLLVENLLTRVLVIYITVDDETILERLKRRGLTEEEISRRMNEDINFWQQFKDNYDFIVENIPGQLDGTVDKVSKIIEERKRMQ